MSREEIPTWKLLRALYESEGGYLKIETLKSEWSYRILARNAHIGIWVPEKKGFIIPRWKFGKNYLFTEFHWDTGPPFGTVKPFFEIERSPFRSEDLNTYHQNPIYNKILFYLNRLTETYPHEEQIKTYWEQVLAARGRLRK